MNSKTAQHLSSTFVPDARAEGTQPASASGAPTADERESAAARAQLNRLMRELQDVRDQRDEAFRALERAHQDTLFRLARAAEHKDGEVGAHMQRVGAFSAMIAEALGCPTEYCEMLYKAAQMHDIGKIGIHESILRKTGPLTSDEWRLMREHPRIGASILAGSDAPVLQLAAEVSMAHHEHFSGAGYPQGLSGDAIPLSGRIVALADFFDTLSIDRCYRPARGDAEILEMIRERRGQQFDPRVVDAFFGIVDQLLVARDAINAVEEIADVTESDADWCLIF